MIFPIQQYQTIAKTPKALPYLGDDTLIFNDKGEISNIKVKLPNEDDKTVKKNH